MSARARPACLPALLCRCSAASCSAALTTTAHPAPPACLFAGVVLLFGPGTTTLFSLLVSGALWQATEYFLPSRLSVLSTAALALLPVLLMKTGYPDYLTPGPKLTHTVLSLASVAAGAVALLLLQADAAAVAAGAFTPLLLALAVLIAVSYLLRAVEWKPAVLGPFYHFERRATVLTVSTLPAYCLLIAC